jgi:CBS domain containing-hemolysin-like protein
MNHTTPSRESRVAGRTRWIVAAVAPSALLAALPARASLFSGDTLDLVADIMAWVVLVIAPVIAIGVFWIVHILPEKIAEKNHHPQANAIKTLCLLSLFFGGLLWPLAWLWAYSKPVLYRMAYGTDRVVHGEHEEPAATTPPTLEEPTEQRGERQPQWTEEEA